MEYQCLYEKQMTKLNVQVIWDSVHRYCIIAARKEINY